MSNFEEVHGRQGDVVYYRVKEGVDLFSQYSGEDFGDVELGGVTIIKGEATGHHHQFYPAENVVKAKALGVQKGVPVFLVRTKGPTELRHFDVIKQEYTREHGSHMLPAGDWVVTGQRQGSGVNGRTWGQVYD